MSKAQKCCIGANLTSSDEEITVKKKKGRSVAKVSTPGSYDLMDSGSPPLKVTNRRFIRSTRGLNSKDISPNLQPSTNKRTSTKTSLLQEIFPEDDFSD